MRDLILLGLLPFLLYCSLKRPFIGLSLWLWSSLVPVSVWAYGPATSIRWNMLFALCTIVSYMFSSSKRQPFYKPGLFFLVLLFFVHASVSTFFHIGIDVHVWTEWGYLFKSIVFFVFVALIVRSKLHVEALMWACALSISAKASLDGLKVLLSGGSHLVKGITPTFNDNNLSALAVLVCLPMLFYLFELYKNNKLLKVGLLGLIFTNILFILGSDSRGGFLGLSALAMYFFIKSDKKLPIAFLGIVIGGIALSILDASWFDRMQTIQNADQDSSFMSRVISWKLSTILALQRPLFGGGFDAIIHPATWNMLVLDFNTLSFISSPMPSEKDLHVAHSIYFQVLGDQGFLGFIIYFSIMFGAFKASRKIYKNKACSVEVVTFAKYMSLSFLAFLVAGAALNVAYNEIIIMLVAVLCSSLFRTSQAEQAQKN